MKVEDIEGIGPAHAATLQGAGIRSSDALLERAGPKAGRDALALALSPDGGLLAVAGPDPIVRLVDVDSGRTRATLRRPAAEHGRVDPAGHDDHPPRVDAADLLSLDGVHPVHLRFEQLAEGLDVPA